MTPPYRPRFDPATGLCLVDVPGGHLVGLGWEVRLAHGGLAATARVVDVTTDGDGTTVRWESEGGLGGAWHVALVAPYELTVRLEVTNHSDRAVPLTALEPFVLEPRRGGVAGLTGAPATWQVVDPGFQSWSPARTFPLGARRPAPRAGMVRTMAVHPWRVDPRRAGLHTLDWAADVQTPWGGFLVGVLEPNGMHAEIVLDARTSFSMRARSCAEGLPLPPGESRSSGTFLVLREPGRNRLATWAARLGTALGARTTAPAPVGWCSWYDYYTRVTEADVDANLAALAPLREALGVTLFQVDDGYQADLGDWLLPRATFPSGMKAVAARIRQAGFTPGLWLAPFVARPTSQVAKAHPDWFLTTAGGRRRSAGVNPWWGGSFHALDLTHPGVRAWLRETIGTLVHDWGLAFLKIDFIYAGMLDGGRHDPSKTTYETYRSGVALIREVAGDEAAILGCGAPLVPSVGLVDVMRIGPDVAEYWRRPLVDWLTGLESTPGARQSLKDVLSRHALHERLWQNDPDCLLVRKRNSKLSLDEVRTLATIVGLSGGMRMISDDVSRLEPDRLALLQKVLPPPSWPARVARVGAEPDLLVLTLPGDRRVVAWVNWSEKPEALRLTAAKADLPAGPVAAVDAWTGATYEADLAAGPLVTEPIPAHGVALLHLVPIGATPRLVSGDVHVGLAELKGEAWDESTGTLTLDVALPGTRDGSYWVHTGAHAEVSVVLKGGTARGTDRDGRWVRTESSLG